MPEHATHKDQHILFNFISQMGSPHSTKCKSSLTKGKTLPVQVQAFKMKITWVITGYIEI